MQNLFSRFPVLVFSLAALASTFFPQPALAVIKEPDNRVWGQIVLGTNLVSAADTNIVVEARRSLSESPLASYRMGDNRVAGSFYSLAIPLESVNPITGANSTRTGEAIIILVHNGQFVRYLTLYTVGARGKIVRLDLGDVDSDNNGLVDNWERQFFLTAGQDPNGDPDRDGVSNRNEMLGATNPLFPDARHPADTSPTNNVITIGEVTAYALAWKTGKAWPVAPTNIPVEFVARAGYLWKNGERYIMDTNNLAAGAPLWWTNAPPETNVSRNVAAAGIDSSKNTLVRKSAIRNQKSVAGGQWPVGSDQPSEIGNQESRINNGMGRVVRSVAGGVAASDPITVTLQVQPAADVSTYALEEVLPAGWVPTAITGEGAFDMVSQRLRWGLFFDHTERTLSYQVQRNSATAAASLLSGNASFDGWTVETTGASSLAPDAIGPQFHAPVVMRNGDIHVKLTGEPGQTYAIQVSNDLIEWSTVATVTAGQAGQIDFRETMEHLDRQRFYRARRAVAP